MSTKLRLYLGRKIIDSFEKSNKLSPTQLQSHFQIETKTLNTNIELSLPFTVIENDLGITTSKEIRKIQPDDIIKSVSHKADSSNGKICFEVDKNIFIRDILENCARSQLHLTPKNVVVDFSSVNIAKPFHMGHLRSTIIGNFISNLNTFMNNRVTKLNYLGDWGTQFGFVKVGVDELGYSPENIQNDPLKLLYYSYVHANKIAEKDTTVLEKAKQEFNKLESGEADTDYWRDYVNYSKTELEATYKRLGIHFDEFHYESMYRSSEIQPIIEEMTRKNVIAKEPNGKQVAIVNGQKISILKSDGSTLYLTRDIAAAIDRFKKYEFDRMFYVVDNAQSDHFIALKAILEQMDLPWANRLHHIKFGRIRGMSSRKGNAVFLKDILDEAGELMVAKQMQSPTTKASINDEKIANILGVSCVIINDLKQRRQRDYDFNWDRVLQAEGDTGIKLQYAHCRLVSLKKNAGATCATNIIPEIFNQNESIYLIKELGRFEEVLFRTNEQLEACILVNYLFHLCNHINKALKVLKVKGTDPDIASQRLLLFETSRLVLYKGMTILGLQPLEEM